MVAFVSVGLPPPQAPGSVQWTRAGVGGGAWKRGGRGDARLKRVLELHPSHPGQRRIAGRAEGRCSQ